MCGRCPHEKKKLDLSALGFSGAQFKQPSREEMWEDLKQKGTIMGIAIFAIRITPFIIQAVRIFTSKDQSAS